jgi:hypothetical protein
MNTASKSYAFKKTRVVTIPTFKLKTGIEYFFKFQTPMELGKEIKNSTMGRATVLRGLDLETGELGIVICRSVLQNELNEQYPGESYVGRCFSVSLYKVPEKRWTGVNLSEVSDPTEDPEWLKMVSLTAIKRREDAQSEGSDPGDEGDDEGDDETPDPMADVAIANASASSRAAAKTVSKGGKRGR